MGGYKDLNLRRAELGAAGLILKFLPDPIDRCYDPGIGFRNAKPAWAWVQVVGFLPNASYREMQRLFFVLGHQGTCETLNSKL